MRSFTSNSNHYLLRNAVVAFGVTLIVCVLAGLIIYQRFPLETWKGNLPTVDINDSYMVMEAYSDQAYDLYTLYYGIGDTIKEAQKADVLILGNSKPFFAFRNEAVRAFTQKTGIRVFDMAVPYGDGVTMAKDLIDRFHLSPSILVINENHFFDTTLSPYGVETVKMGYWQAFVKVVEHSISWFFRFRLHQLFPRFGLGKMYGAMPVVEYRSHQTGCLAMENFAQYPVPAATHSVQEESLFSDELNTALQFKKEMQDRGIKIILTSVPYGTDDMNHLDKWIKDPERRILISKAEEPYERVDKTARLLGLPLIAPPATGLIIFDGRHLDEKSASKFSDLFFTEFLKRPEVKTLLNSKK